MMRQAEEPCIATLATRRCYMLLITPSQSDCTRRPPGESARPQPSPARSKSSLGAVAGGEALNQGPDPAVGGRSSAVSGRRISPPAQKTSVGRIRMERIFRDLARSETHTPLENGGGPSDLGNRGAPNDPGSRSGMWQCQSAHTSVPQ